MQKVLLKVTKNNIKDLSLLELTRYNEQISTLLHGLKSILRNLNLIEPCEIVVWYDREKEKRHYFMVPKDYEKFLDLVISNNTGSKIIVSYPLWVRAYDVTHIVEQILSN